MKSLKDYVCGLVSEFDKTMFPEYRCYMCGRETANEFLCDDCEKLIKYIKPPFCLKCGAPVEEFNNYCDNCKEYAYYFDEARASFLYDQNTSKLFYRLKIEGDKFIAKFLASKIYKTLLDSKIKADIIVPVPLHKKRLKERGYNQSYLIAEELSNLSGIPLKSNLIEKVKNTNTQSNLGRAERQKNLSCAFKYVSSEKIAGKNILIVDDIYTTGATVNEISKVIRKHRPNKIYVISAGKTQFFKL